MHITLFRSSYNIQLDTSFKQEKLLLHGALIINYRKRERKSNATIYLYQQRQALKGSKCCLAWTAKIHFFSAASHDLFLCLHVNVIDYESDEFIWSVAYFVLRRTWASILGYFSLIKSSHLRHFRFISSEKRISIWPSSSFYIIKFYLSFLSTIIKLHFLK